MSSSDVYFYGFSENEDYRYLVTSFMVNGENLLKYRFHYDKDITQSFGVVQFIDSKKASYMTAKRNKSLYYSCKPCLDEFIKYFPQDLNSSYDSKTIIEIHASQFPLLLKKDEKEVDLIDDELYMLDYDYKSIMPLANIDESCTIKFMPQISEAYDEVIYEIHIDCGPQTIILKDIVGENYADFGKVIRQLVGSDKIVYLTYDLFPFIKAGSLEMTKFNRDRNTSIMNELRGLLIVGGDVTDSRVSKLYQDQDIPSEFAHRVMLELIWVTYSWWADEPTYDSNNDDELIYNY